VATIDPSTRPALILRALLVALLVIALVGLTTGVAVLADDSGWAAPIH